MISLDHSSRSSSDTYNVSWKSQQSHISEGLRDMLRQDSVLTDVTLACEGEYINAHKVVLSLCSSYFKDLFQKNRADKSNTIVILGNVNARNMRYLLRYMYEGKVSLPNRHVDGFLKAGIALKVGGLSKTSEEDVEQIKPVTLRTSISSRKRSIPSASQSNAKRMSTVKLSFSEDLEKDDGGSSHDEGNGDVNDVEHDYEVTKPLTRVHVKTEPQENDNEDDNEDMNEVCELEDEDKNDSTWVSKRSPSTASGRGQGGRSAIFKRPSVFSKVKRTRRRRSVVWKFFTPDPTRAYATCKLCTEDEVQLKTTMGGTTGLLNHLIKQHPGVLTNVPTVPHYRHSIASTSTTDHSEKPSDTAPKSQPNQEHIANSSNSNAGADDTM